MSALVAISTPKLIIELPEDIAREAERISREENIEVQELFRRALRLFELDRIHRFIEAVRPQASRDELDQQEDARTEEVSALIKAMRRQDEQEQTPA
jgi:hypothetical protein